MQSSQRLQELADFLRTRRSRLNPQTAGLSANVRRRTRGLRREEVAELAGISTTWYTWLEQGRPIKISPKTADAIANALQLDASERAHFIRLLEQENFTPSRSIGDETELQPEIKAVLNTFQSYPAFIINHRWDLVRWNAAAEYVFRFAADNDPRANFIRFIFSNAYFKQVSCNWEMDVRQILAQFRPDYDLYVQSDKTLETLVNELRKEHANFKLWWNKHDVIYGTGWDKELMHPEVGILRFKSMVMQRTSQPFPRIVIYVPDEDSCQKIQLPAR